MMRFFPFLIFKIKGESMLPTLKEGDYVLILKTSKIKQNDIILLRDPRNGHAVVKRVLSIKPREYFVIGDNPEQSTDSRHFGWVGKNLVVGKVVKRIA